VQQSTKIDLVINLKTAKAPGITFPITLPGRADGVTEQASACRLLALFLPGIRTDVRSREKSEVAQPGRDFRK
jgi:hypothetical protein